MNTIKEVTDYLKTKNSVYFYGAGRFAKRIEKQFIKCGIHISGYIVTSRGENPLTINEKPVWTREEFLAQEIHSEDIAIVVAFKGEKYELMDELMDCGLKGLLFLSSRFYDDLWLYERCDRYTELQNEYYLDIHRMDMEFGQGGIVEKKTGLSLFRAPIYHQNIESAMSKYCTRELFEKEYGKLVILPHGQKAGITSEKANAQKVEMYVITSHLDHAKTEDIQRIGYIPLQVGAAYTDFRKGCLTDNTGDHISKRNRDYCECTGLYWIWKNTSNQNYVGMSHYRRRLELDDEAISSLEKEEIDVVLPIPQFCTNTIQEFFFSYIGKRDWDYLKNAVIAYDSEYEAIFQEHEKSHFYFPCNVFLMQRKWFDAYCEFAFWVADRVESEYEKRGITRNDRYMGYLFENMTTLFVKRYYKEMKVVCSEIEWISS